MRPGDDVVVTNLDGETAEGELVEATGKRADEVEIPINMRHGEPTLAQYWFGKIEPAEEVLRVRLGGTVYSYPESKVEVLEEP